MPTYTTEDGSSSICVQPKYAPIHYHWFRLAADRPIMAEVIAIVSALDLTENTKDLLVGAFSARLIALVDGELKPRVHIKGPMGTVKHLKVFELRAGVDVGESDSAEIRAYHVEPSDLKVAGGSTIVGLHVHHKIIKDSGTYAAQNEEIEKAVARHDEGRTNAWGGAALLPRASKGIDSNL